MSVLEILGEDESNQVVTNFPALLEEAAEEHCRTRPSQSDYSHAIVAAGL